MTNLERATELRRLRARVQTGDLRSDIQERRNLLASITPLLNFNEVYYSNALEVADLLARPGFSSNAYEHAAARLDSLMGQAVTELQHELTPPAESASPAVPAMTDEQGVLWFWHHCAWGIRWRIVALCATALLTAASFGFAFGRHNLFVQLFDLIQSSSSPIKTP